MLFIFNNNLPGYQVERQSSKHLGWHKLTSSDFFLHFLAKQVAFETQLAFLLGLSLTKPSLHTHIPFV